MAGARDCASGGTDVFTTSPTCLPRAEAEHMKLTRADVVLATAIIAAFAAIFYLAWPALF